MISFSLLILNSTSSVSSGTRVFHWTKPEAVEKKKKKRRMACFDVSNWERKERRRRMMMMDYCGDCSCERDVISGATSTPSQQQKKKTIDEVRTDLHRPLVRSQ
jgi:hypothetical protein